MIDSTSAPVAWVLLIDELREAHEHLGELIKQMQDEGNIDQEEFAVHLGHVYAHLNRGWHSRAQADAISESQWEPFSQFPKDITPVG